MTPSVLSEPELRAHLARLLQEARVTMLDHSGVPPVPVVTVDDASRIFAQWLKQQEAV